MFLHDVPVAGCLTFRSKCGCIMSVYFYWSRLLLRRMGTQNMANRKKKKTNGGIYLVRRTGIVLLILVAVGAAVWGLSGRDVGVEPSGEEPSSEAEPVSDSSSEASESEDEVISLSESEPSSESEEEESEASESESESEAQQAPVSAAQPPTSNSGGDWSLILVNPTSPLPEGYQVALETVAAPYQVDARIADDLRMMFAHAKEDGITLIICSAYRSVEKQEQLFAAQTDRHKANGLSEEAAVAATANAIAVPGTSEHHTGLAVDIVTPNYQTLDSGFANTPAAQWLAEHAPDYGFILRYPLNKQSITQIMYEPWHFRYVGRPYAREITDSGYCLEEYAYVSATAQPKAQAENSEVSDEANGEASADDVQTEE